MIQVPNLWVFPDLFLDDFDLSLEDSPETPVLDSFNLYYVCIRKSPLELGLNPLELGALLVYFDDHANLPVRL